MGGDRCSAGLARVWLGHTCIKSLPCVAGNVRPGGCRATHALITSQSEEGLTCGVGLGNVQLHEAAVAALLLVGGHKVLQALRPPPGTARRLHREAQRRVPLNAWPAACVGFV